MIRSPKKTGPSKAYRGVDLFVCRFRVLVLEMAENNAKKAKNYLFAAELQSSVNVLTSKLSEYHSELPRLKAAEEKDDFETYLALQSKLSRVRFNCDKVPGLSSSHLSLIALAMPCQAFTLRVVISQTSVACANALVVASSCLLHPLKRLFLDVGPLRLVQQYRC